jgi:hypothetical protein
MLFYVAHCTLTRNHFLTEYQYCLCGFAKPDVISYNTYIDNSHRISDNSSCRCKTSRGLTLTHDVSTTEICDHLVCRVNAVDDTLSRITDMRYRRAVKCGTREDADGNRRVRDKRQICSLSSPRVGESGNPARLFERKQAS